MSHSLGSGSPDTLRNTSECNFSLILSELSFEWKNPTNGHAPFIFMTVQAKEMEICEQDFTSLRTHIGGVCKGGIFKSLIKKIHFSYLEGKADLVLIVLCS